VLMPMELALHDSQTDNAIIDLSERLVIPGIFARIDKPLNVDELKRRKESIEMD